MQPQYDRIKVIDCRGPRGPCGLKYQQISRKNMAHWSRPARALWIEINRSSLHHSPASVEAREGLVD